MDTSDALRPKQARRPVDQTPTATRRIGKYQFLSKIGCGGMGDVYLAEDMPLKRKVAIKVINIPTIDPDKRDLHIQRFKREAQASARISHANVVTVYAFDEIDGEHLLVMEHLSGRTLRQELDRGGAIRPDIAMKYMVDILRGLEAIHDARMCHRDLKPQNVMHTDSGCLKILDLGLVKFNQNDLANDPTLTQAGTAMGSPTYMAPEQILKAQHLDKEFEQRADIYALGVTLFHLVAGQPPFSGSQHEVFHHHIVSPVPKLVSPHASVPEGLQAVVRKAMAKDPADRYQTAGEMRKAIEDVRREMRRPGFKSLPPVPAKTNEALPLRTKPPSVPPPIPAAARREKPAEKPAEAPKKARVSLLALLLLPLLGLGALGLVFWGMERKAAAPAPNTVTAPSKEEALPSTKAEPPEVLPTPESAALAATATEGCAASRAGDYGKAVTILKRVVAKTPRDPEARYCLCEAEHYLRSADERQDCAAYLRLPNLDRRKSLQVKLWLR